MSCKGGAWSSVAANHVLQSKCTCCVKSRHASVNKGLEVRYSCRAHCPIAVSLAPAKCNTFLRNNT